MSPALPPRLYGVVLRMLASRLCVASLSRTGQSSISSSPLRLRSLRCSRTALIVSGECPTQSASSPTIRTGLSGAVGLSGIARELLVGHEEISDPKVGFRPVQPRSGLVDLERCGFACHMVSDRRGVTRSSQSMWLRSSQALDSGL